VFESLSGWGSYTNVNVTNGWYSTPEDMSVITNMGTYVFTNCSKPLESSAHSNVLKLATEGATLTNLFGAVGVGVDVSTNIVYLDTMVQFVASETAPTACTTLTDTGIKAAIYADANTNLTVYCGVRNTTGGFISNALVNSSIQLNATNWYRLTVVFDATFNDSFGIGQFPVFQVKINGVTITNNSGFAYDDNWKAYTTGHTLPTLSNTSVGSWFPSGSLDANLTKLTAVAFQGTGYIDDMVVSFAQPVYTNNTAPLNSTFWLTVVNGGSGTSDLGGVNSNPLTQVQITAPYSTTIVYTASQWFKIATFSSTSNGVSPVGLGTYTQYLDNISADVSNVVTFVKPEWTIYQYVTNGSAPANGSSVTVTNGDTYAQTFSGNTQWYELTSLLQDGGEIGIAGVNTQLVTISEVQGDHTLAANFYLPSYAVTAVVDGGNGVGAVSASPVNKGAPVQITYTGDSWYRINTLTTNSQNVAGASGRYVTVDVANVVGSIAATGSFSLAVSNPFGVDTAWLQKWGHDENAATNGANTINGVLASMEEQYLLDVDPYIPESATFKVNAIGVTGGTNVAVTVGLQVNSGNHTNINGTLSLESKTALTNATWTSLGATAVTGAVFTNGVHTYNFVDTVSNSFYKAVIQ
jgi:hypothetical protein